MAPHVDSLELGQFISHHESYGEGMSSDSKGKFESGMSLGFGS